MSTESSRLHFPISCAALNASLHLPFLAAVSVSDWVGNMPSKSKQSQLPYTQTYITGTCGGGCGGLLA